MLFRALFICNLNKKGRCKINYICFTDVLNMLIIATWFPASVFVTSQRTYTPKLFYKFFPVQVK